MLETPLHHCYLLPAQQPVDCIATLETQIESAVDDSDLLHIETMQIDRLTIELALELRDRGQQKAVGEVRCLIYTFNSITVDAQNALLKIIENPARGIHFFFITPMVEGLLETVRSRSWILSDLCNQKDTEKIVQMAEDFYSAKGLAKCLAIVDEVDTIDELRLLVRALSKREISKRRELGQAIELVAAYSQDNSASLKLLRELLAVAASRSPSSS